MMTGLAYGYKIKLHDGREVKGDRIIDQEIAPIIREIFEMYADGHSLSSMVEILNSREIPSPRGGEWQKTALIGSIKRYEGLLCNQLYRGRVIWNQKSKRINPETGGKNYFVNPESEWVITEREDLRIVSEELWTRCDLRKVDRKSINKKAVQYYTFNPYRQLVFCGSCHGQKTLADRKRYVCRSWKAKRTCNNARGTRQAAILEEIQYVLQDSIKIKSDKQICDEINSILNLGQRKRHLLLKEVKRLDLCIKQTTSLIGSKGIDLDIVTDRLKEFQHQHADLQVQLAETIDPPKRGIKSLFLQTIDDLIKALGSPQRNDRYRLLLKLLVEKIILTPITRLPYGETIDVMIADNAWVNLHQYICKRDSKS
jgi:hypothetical protein